VRPDDERILYSAAVRPRDDGTVRVEAFRVRNVLAATAALTALAARKGVEG